MPRRADLKKILIIGSGPIVIGQGCEFDYSGVQACKALRAVGFEIVLVNSNPATIMTDPDMADHTYIEPITWQSLAEIIKIERPDAVLSTMGGQTALNCALELETKGILQQYNVELIGANKNAIEKAEDRDLFRNAMKNIGLDTPRSFVATNMQQATLAQVELGFPIIIRPSYTLGGSGGGIAYNVKEFEQICRHGFDLSRNHQLLIEESLLGWKEYELEVVRDANDTCIIVCTIENLDPMGIHTGDSITVAPAQTLTDKEYQIMRNAAIAILREIGVQTGGSNVQFALHPKTGRMIVIEMNPRVSRSSALASKATGFPIAKIAALLAVGYTLDELKNDITGGVIPASFEPTIDYVVVKIPRFNFDKFPHITPLLTTQMQAVGEVMSIGGNFQAALQKALCSLELDLNGFSSQIALTSADAVETIIQEIKHAGPLRILYVADAFRAGFSIEDIYLYSAIDPWFLDQIQNLLNIETIIQNIKLKDIQSSQILQWKQAGFSDSRLAELLNTTESSVRELRLNYNLKPKFKRIDSCAAEFPSPTPYLYATYEGDCEAHVSSKPKVIVLGSGPNRIGQGIEFDYCCVQAVQALQEHFIEAIMINCNPETVSTDYDISDRLYFEGLTLETVLDIIQLEQPLGVILQLGGQTPLKLASALHDYGVPILGTSPDTIDLAEDRGQFAKIINKLKLQQPNNALVKSVESGLSAAEILGYPLMVRPSYVLGGRAMEVVYDITGLQAYLIKSFAASNNAPVLIDCFLQNAIEVDVDVVADAQGGVWIAGIMQHIEPAGVHSGDSASCLPPFNLSELIQQRIKIQAESLALELKIIGLMNIQFAVQGEQIYILEVNPRASRSVPFVSKAIGKSLAKVAVSCMLGQNLEQLNIPTTFVPEYYAVKQSVFPFVKFPGADPLLGPEMRSTGEIMAFGKTFAEAYRKSLQAVGLRELKAGGRAYVSISLADCSGAIELIRELLLLEFEVLICMQTAVYLQYSGELCRVVYTDEILNLIAHDRVDLIISTLFAKEYLDAAVMIRTRAIRQSINCCTTIAAARTLVLTISDNVNVRYKLQSLNTNHIDSKIYI
jgi:carbamoyl-phosphate synthase large subunit